MADGCWVAAARAARAAGRPLALMFDYDGTLAPIAPRPALAVLPGRARELLRELAGLPGVRVAVVSGRGLDDLAAMVALPGLDLVGCGGAELLLRGVRQPAPLAEPARRALGAAETAVRVGLGRFPGLWVEPKRFAFTVHYRGADPAAVAAFDAHLGRVLALFPGLTALRVCEAYEVCPADTWDKGAAVNRILAAEPPGALAVYVGDAENDLPARAAARAAGGLAVAVGPTVAHAADHALASPEALARDLEGLCAGLPGRCERPDGGRGP